MSRRLPTSSLRSNARCSRREALQRGVALVAAGLMAGARPSALSAATRAGTLKSAAARCGIAFGAAIDSEVFSDAAYAELVRREVSVTGNINAFKYDWLRPTGPEANFAAADRLLAFAETAGLPFTATALFWNDYPPPWLAGQTTEDLRRLFDAHCDEVCQRYAGRVAAWVVVNEPFAPWDNAPGDYRKGPWFGAFGPEYIRRAFRRARRADPGAVLILNEAFCERRDEIGATVRDRFLALVRDLRDRDVPVDRVGLQGHIQPQHGLDHDAYVRFMTALAETGVDLEITELDVDDSRIKGSRRKRAAAVAGHYNDFVSAVTTVPALKQITLWGLSDRYTWYREVAAKANALAPHDPQALPFDANGRATPAKAAILRAFKACANR